MKKITYPFKLIPSAYGTRLKFSGEEEGRWVIELDAHLAGESLKKRIQLVFSGVSQARVNDDVDRTIAGEYLLMQIGNSEWLDGFLNSYVQEFGRSLLPVVKNIQHFIVRGHDCTIGILAREVECMAID